MRKRGALLVSALLLAAALMLSGCTERQAEEGTTLPEATTTLMEVTSSTTTPTTTSTSKVATTSKATTTTTYPLVENPQVSASLSTDKKVYHSNEYMNITVVFESSDDLYQAGYKLYGIKAGYYRIEKNERIDLPSGYSIKNYVYQAPRCYGCAGIKPGTYNLTLEIAYNGKTIATSMVEFEMQQ